MQTNSIIRLLDENTINQIAAGEVIENSASIIKELVENSIDAKAANITIEIVSGGRQNIRITDDGIGMSFDDVRLSLQRHATSKIKKAEDLSHIHTMGFRGEALSSITSVSKIKIFSKQKNSLLGTYLYAEGGQVLEHKEVECNEGTKIEVSQLFFNAPVRRKFLKSIDVDSANCQKTAIEIALAHPEVSLKLVSNQKLLINAPQGSLENRIKDVLGQDFLNDMRPVIYQDDGIKIEGFLSDPKKTRPNRSGQYILLNNRFITCPAISFSIMDAYATLLEPRRFPLFVLKIEIDPNLVDINVHPQKKEVRLRKESFLKVQITKSVEKTFNKAYKEAGSLPWEEPQFPKTSFFNPIDSLHALPLNGSNCVTKEAAALTITPFNFSQADTSFNGTKTKNEEVEEPYEVSFEPSFEQDKMDLQLNEAVVVGLFNEFILVEKEKTLHFIDPQRLVSRIYFEDYKQKGGDNLPMQQLLIALNFSFSPQESIIIEKKIDKLFKMGIDLRPFGPNTFIVEAHSLKLDEDMIEKLIIGFLKNEDEVDMYKAFSHLRSLKIKKPSFYEAEALIKTWQSIGFPDLCPKGNPISWKLPLEKIFN